MTEKLSSDPLQDFVDGVCEACDLGESTIVPPRSGIVKSLPVHRPSGTICTKAIPRNQREILAKAKGWKS